MHKENVFFVIIGVILAADFTQAGWGYCVTEIPSICASSSILCQICGEINSTECWVGCPYSGGICCGGDGYCCPLNWLCVRYGATQRPGCFNILAHAAVKKALGHVHADREHKIPETNNLAANLEQELENAIAEERMKMNEIDKRDDEASNITFETPHPGTTGQSLEQQTYQRLHHDITNKIEQEQEEKTLEGYLRKKEAQLREQSHKSDEQNLEHNVTGLQRFQEESSQKASEEQDWKKRHEEMVKSQIRQQSKANEITFKSEAESKRSEEISKRGAQEGRDRMLREQDTKGFLIEAQEKQAASRTIQERSLQAREKQTLSFNTEAIQKLGMWQNWASMNSRHDHQQESAIKFKIQDSLRMEHHTKGRLEVNEKQNERMRAPNQGNYNSPRALSLTQQLEHDQKLMFRKHEAIEMMQKTISEEHFKKMQNSHGVTHVATTREIRSVQPIRQQRSARNDSRNTSRQQRPSVRDREVTSRITALQQLQALQLLEQAVKTEKRSLQFPVQQKRGVDSNENTIQLRRHENKAYVGAQEVTRSQTGQSIVNSSIPPDSAPRLEDTPAVLQENDHNTQKASAQIAQSLQVAQVLESEYHNSQ